MTQIDWGQALEDDIDDGPAPRSPSAAVAAGRRALRGRRLLQAGLGGAALVLATTVGVGAVALTDRDSPVEFATQRAYAHHPVPASTDLPIDPRLGSVPVYFDGRGRLVRASAEVTVEGVYTDVLSPDGSAYWDRTAAVATTWEGQSTWYLVRWKKGGGASGQGLNPRVDMDFDEWVSRLPTETGLLTGRDPQ